MAQPFLGDKDSAFGAPGADVVMANRLAEKRYLFRPPGKAFARQHIEQLGLAVAGNSGDADDFAGKQIE